MLFDVPDEIAYFFLLWNHSCHHILGDFDNIQVEDEQIRCLIS